MKLKLTEKQYNLLLEYLDEARKAPTPEKLSLFFNDNPNAQFFNVVQRDKSGSDSSYDFKLSEINGYKVITDINKGTKTKGCSVDANFDTMIYGNQLKLNFGKCGVLTINNVTGLNIFNDANSLKNNQPFDRYDLEHDFDKSSSEMVTKYYEAIKKLDTGDIVNFDSKFKYDGEVIQKYGPVLRIEIEQQGRKGRTMILTVDLNVNPFYEEDGNVMFKAKSNRGDEEQTDFIIPVKKMYVDDKDSPIQQPSEEPTEKNLEVDDDDEKLKQDGKIAMELILNDPNLKKAFYTQPTLWNLFVAELQGKKAVGRGIVPTLKIIRGYERKKISEELNSEFKENKKVTFKPFKSVKIPYVRNEKQFFYEFDKDSITEYETTVLPRNLGEGYKLKGKTDKGYLGFELEIENSVKDNQNVFKCSLDLIVYKQKTTNRYPYDGDFYIKIAVDGGKSPGYAPIENKEKK